MCLDIGQSAPSDRCSYRPRRLLGAGGCSLGEQLKAATERHRKQAQPNGLGEGASISRSAGSSSLMPSSRPARLKITIAAASTQTKLKANSTRASHGLMSPAITRPAT